MLYINLGIKFLVASNIHLGSNKNRWNPALKSFIVGYRGGFHMFDLNQTLYMTRRALSFLSYITTKRGNVIFVCDDREKAIKNLIIKSFALSNNFAVIGKWICGFLTNFKSQKSIVNYLKFVRRFPSAIVLLNSNDRKWCLNEALLLNIPIISVLDSNKDLFGISYPIPGNSQSISSKLVFTMLFRNALIDGQWREIERVL